jgi:hypothetical protein
MKHIFTIHSHITFLVAYSIVEYLNLDRNDVIFLSSRYKVTIKGFNVQEAYQTRFQTIGEKLLTFNAPKSHDRYINKLTNGDSFIAYIDLMSYYQKILITHPQCACFHFFEEGNGAYMSYDDMTDITWPERQIDYRTNGIMDSSYRKAIMRTLRGYNLRLLSIPYNYMAFANFKDLKYFCFSPNAFCNAPKEKKVIVAPKKDDPDVKSMALNTVLVNETIWIDGSNGRYTGLDESYYYRAIDKAIPLLKERGILNSRVYVKLRFNENESNNYLINALKHSSIKEIIILPNFSVLEALFAVSSSCNVIGTLSSALEYAHCFGHKSYSIYSLFEKRSKTFFDRMDGYWNDVELL